MKNLVIVESPTKARTLGQFLGSDYRILASMGHVRDLPRGEFGVDVERNFEPKYVIPKEKIKSVNALAKDAAGAEHLFLATDPDREGEAIAWNLLQVIIERGKRKNPPYSRVVFHEITKDAVLDAFAHSRKIDDDLVEAQQSRRVLDRLVGYKLSPLLWKKVKSGLSAGRVQSVALRLVVDREREIEAFKTEEYWVIQVKVKSQKSKVKNSEFIVTLSKINNEKAQVKNKSEADKIVGDLEKAAYRVAEIKSRDVKKYPNPPFTTSTLQQAAANRLGFAPKRTMKVAQDLYESGLITYMRTDSVNLSEQAVQQTRKLILEKYGKDYLPLAPRRYKVRSRLAQEAHEAIRPTNITVDPLREASSSQLAVDSNDHRKLYDLIYKRMLVCQMAEAVVAETTVDVEAKVKVESQSFDKLRSSTLRLRPEGMTLSKSKGQSEKSTEIYQLRASGQKIKFDGWYKAYAKLPISEQMLPSLVKDEQLDLVEVKPEQKFTEPPPRFTEATLIKELEKNDIGRPSTYAPTISTLYERVYIEKVEGKKIAPTPIGTTTVDFLVKYFPNIVDLSFTAEMEDGLDQIAQGKQEMAPTMEKFWEPFEMQVDKVSEEAQKMKVEVEQTDVQCDVCGKPMVIRYGRFGKFLACSGFPECKNTKTMSAPTGLTCPVDDGNIVMKKTRRGRNFWGCENWPKCKFASWQKPGSGKQVESPSLPS